MHIATTIFAGQVSPEQLAALGERGELLIEQIGLRGPIACHLFGDDGQCIARFVRGRREVEFFTATHRRTQWGASLLLNDGTGRAVEVFLVVGSSTRVQ